MVSEAPADMTDAFLTSAGTFAIELDGRHVLGYECGFQVQAYTDDLFVRHAIRFPSQLATAVTKRKSTYLAGRVCAQRLLLHLGLASPNVDIPIGADRCPVWPPAVAASITHTDMRAACIAAMDPEVLGLGIDIESLLAPAQATELKSQIVDAREEALLRREFPTFEHGLSVAFSAKESLFKALYPSVGRFFDFDAAKVRAVQPSYVNLEIAEPLSERVSLGIALRVKYTVEEGTVTTVACFIRRQAET